MPTALTATEDCFVVRSDARHVTQRYEQFLAPIGPRATQFSILTKLKRRDVGLSSLLGPCRWSSASSSEMAR
jgi:hypothetical protein